MKLPCLVYNYDSHERQNRSPDSVWSWIVCVAATICNALHFGVSLSFGVLLPYLLEHFKATIERTALVGSLAIAMTFAASLFAGRLIDRFGWRIVSLLGGMTCAVGLTLTSFARDINMLYCSYSLTFGVGSSMLFTSAYLVIPRHFRKRRVLAVGIVAAGGGLGFLALGPLIEICLMAFDWKNTCRIMASTFLVSCLLSCVYDSKHDEVFPSERVQLRCTDLESKGETFVINSPKRKARLFDWSVWTYPAFSVHTLSLSLACVGHYIPQIFIVRYCENLGISSSAASRLLIYIGLATMVTRVLVGVVCDLEWLSASAMNQLAKMLSGAMTIALPFAYRYDHLVIVCVIYGLADGCLITTLNCLFMGSVPSEKLNSAFGFGSIATSVAVALGSPLTGLIADVSHSSDLSFCVAGGIVILSALVPLILCCIPDYGTRHDKKASGKRVLISIDGEKSGDAV